MESEWRATEQTLVPLFAAEDDDGFDLTRVQFVGGLDVSFDVTDPTAAVGTLVVCGMRTLDVVYEVTREFRVTAPYVPGCLAARELGPMLALWEEAKAAAEPESQTHPLPQIVLVDGNGMYHPRRCGSATCFGVTADVPTIGVSKKPFEMEGITRETIRDALAARREKIPLVSDRTGEVLGAALVATSESTNPIFVSQGHRVSLDTAVAVVKACCRHRVPEPIRQADLRSRARLAAASHVVPPVGLAGEVPRPAGSGLGACVV
jgi:deoxyinosine 3'endonuclease (endonuclease V)